MPVTEPLDELFYLIRTEPICLIVGSGFSLYAGIPSAAQIKTVLYNTLSAAEQTQLDLGKELRHFSDDFVTLKGREAMTAILQSVIDIQPADTHLHDQLSKIAYFKSIVTTNYDRLLENSYGDNAAVIIGDKDTFGSLRSKARIFKVHGDIRQPDTIVITNDDYAAQYNRNFKEPFWASVFAEFANQHILFLGYGYEDENIQADFNAILSKVANSARRRFLISPSMTALKTKKLAQSGITHLKLTGAEFLGKLIPHIKKHMPDDLRKGLVNTQISQDIILADDLVVNITASPKSAEIVSIRRNKGETKHEINFSSTDKEFIDEYRKFSSSYERKEMVITPDKLTDFAMVVEGFTLQNISTLAKLNVLHTPKFDGYCTLRFPEAKFKISKVYCRVFNSIPGKVLIEASYAGLEASFNLTLINGQPEMRFNAKEVKEPLTINKAFKAFRCLNLLFSGALMEFYAGKELAGRERLKPFPAANEFKRQMDFFDGLIKIQKAFHIKFPAIHVGSISGEERKLVRKLVALIDHGYYAVKDPEGLTIEQLPEDPKFIDFLSSDKASESMVCLITGSPQSLQLLSRKLELGSEQIILKKPVPAELSYEKRRIRLVPVDQVVVYRYKKFGHGELLNSETILPDDEI